MGDTTWVSVTCRKQDAERVLGIFGYNEVTEAMWAKKRGQLEVHDEGQAVHISIQEVGNAGSVERVVMTGMQIPFLMETGPGYDFQEEGIAFDGETERVILMSGGQAVVRIHPDTGVSGEDFARAMLYLRMEEKLLKQFKKGEEDGVRKS